MSLIFNFSYIHSYIYQPDKIFFSFAFISIINPTKLFAFFLLHAINFWNQLKNICFENIKMFLMLFSVFKGEKTNIFFTKTKWHNNNNKNDENDDNIGKSKHWMRAEKSFIFFLT